MFEPQLSCGAVKTTLNNDTDVVYIAIVNCALSILQCIKLSGIPEVIRSIIAYHRVWQLRVEVEVAGRVVCFADQVTVSVVDENCMGLAGARDSWCPIKGKVAVSGAGRGAEWLAVPGSLCKVVGIFTGGESVVVTWEIFDGSDGRISSLGDVGRNDRCGYG